MAKVHGLGESLVQGADPVTGAEAEGSHLKPQAESRESDLKMLTLHGP